RAQGERHRRPAHSGRYRCRDESPARDRPQARLAHPLRAREGGGREAGGAGAVAGGGVARRDPLLNRKGPPAGGPFFASGARLAMHDSRRQSFVVPGEGCAMKSVARFVLFAALMCCCWSAAAAEDAYPSRTVKFLVPQAPGGATDVFARKVAQLL